MKPFVLIYGFNTEKLENLLNVVNSHNIEYKIALREDLDERLGLLTSVPGYVPSSSSSSHNYPDTEFLLFKDFSRDLLNQFLLDLKNVEIVVPHKAMLTETTVDWTLGYLISHIENERIIVLKYKELGQIVKLSMDNLDHIEEKAEVERLINEAKTLPQIKGEDLTVEDISAIQMKIYEILEKNKLL